MAVGTPNSGRYCAIHPSVEAFFLHVKTKFLCGSIPAFNYWLKVLKTLYVHNKVHLNITES